jgi:hypothetical protein
LEHSHRCGRK